MKKIMEKVNEFFDEYYKSFAEKFYDRSVFSRSYTQRKTADLAGSAVFILSVSIFHKLHLNDLLQASRLVIHPGFHAANIVRLYATVTNVTAVVVLHPDQTLLKIIVLRAVMGVSVEQNGAATHVLPTKDRVMT